MIRSRLATVGAAAAVAALLAVGIVHGRNPGFVQWNGPPGGTFSGPNWFFAGQDGFELVPGDGLTFTPPKSDSTVNNDLIGYNANAVTFSGNNVTLTGNGLGVAFRVAAMFDGHTLAGVTATVDLPVTLTASGARFEAEKPDSVLRLRPSATGTQAAVVAGGYNAIFRGPGTIEVSGDIQGAAAIVQEMGGTLLLRGPITHAGPIQATSLIFHSRTAGGCGSAPQASLPLGATASLTIRCDASLGTLTGTGTVTFQSVSGSVPVLRLGGTATDFDGELVGGSPALIDCCGDGGQARISGDQPFTGNVRVDSGQLVLDLAEFPASSQFTIIDSGVLTGRGLAGQTSVIGGTISPAGDETGTLRFASLSLSDDAITVIDLPDAGAPDLVRVDGEFTAGGALDLRLAGTPAVGTAFTILDGGTSTSGTFEGLPEGEYFQIDELWFRITYAGGASGEDVVLTRFLEPPPPPPPPPDHVVFTALLANG